MMIRFSTYLLAAAVGIGCGPAMAVEKREQLQRRITVERGLKALAARQQKSGAWQLDQFGDSSAATSLAVMAFMAAGHVPGEGPYGGRLQNGIDWVLDHARPLDKAKGQESVLLVGEKSYGPMYAHGISTLMLAEALGKLDRVRANRCRQTLERAVRLIVQAQNVKKRLERFAGGWRYQPTSTDSDLSVTGWQITALIAARSAGLAVPQKTFDRALDYVKRCQSKTTGGFAYQPGFPTARRTATRTAVGVFCLELAGKQQSPEAIAGGKFLLRNPLGSTDEWYFYGAYYVAAASRKLGATHRDLMERTQRVIAGYQLSDGTWLGLRRTRRAGKAYAAAIALLTLSVDSGHLAIYRR